MWVAAHLPDIESDLSVFHRIDDPGPLPAERVYAMTRRLGFYQGVVRARLRAEAHRQQPDVPAGTQWVSSDQMQTLLTQ